MLLKNRKSFQSSRHAIPAVVKQLKKGQEDQLAALKGNVAELKRDFSKGFPDSRFVVPLAMKSVANA